MECANPACKLPALDLSSGLLRLIQLEVPPEERVVRSDEGFPVCSVPSRYFWLCPGCSSFLRIKRWTHEGVIFEHRINGAMSKIDERLLPLCSTPLARSPYLDEKEGMNVEGTQLVVV